MSNETSAYVVDWLKELRDSRRLRRHAAARRGTLLITSFAPPHTAICADFWPTRRKVSEGGDLVAEGVGFKPTSDFRRRRFSSSIRRCPALSVLYACIGFSQFARSPMSIPVVVRPSPWWSAWGSAIVQRRGSQLVVRRPA